MKEKKIQQKHGKLKRTKRKNNDICARKNKDKVRVKSAPYARAKPHKHERGDDTACKNLQNAFFKFLALL